MTGYWRGEGVTQPFMFLLSDHRGESDAGQPEAIRQAGAILKSPLMMRVIRMLGVVRLDGRRQIALTAHCITSFFDVYLKGAPASQLKSLTEFPEIEIVP